MNEKTKEKKIDLKGKKGNLKVNAKKITLEIPNTNALSLEEVESNMLQSDFCKGCTGLFHAVGQFL